MVRASTILFERQCKEQLTVHQKDNSLRFAAALGCRDVAVKSTNLLLLALWRATMDTAAKAAAAHSHACRHLEVSIRNESVDRLGYV